MSEQDIPQRRVLDKINFWNDIAETYPRTMKIFGEWIDQYKKRVHWNVLFHNKQCGGTYQIKFHELPIGMQIGVIIEFISEQGGGSFFGIDPIQTKHDFNRIPDHIRTWFSIKEYNLNKAKNGE